MSVPNVSGVAAEPISAVVSKATQAPPNTVTSPEVRPSPSASGYSNPTMAIDGTTGSAIVEYRSAASGEEVSQTPSRAALEYEQTQRLAAEKSGIAKNGGGQP